METLICDLTKEFLDCWKKNPNIMDIDNFPPYYVGGIVVSVKGSQKYIIDGQQRITTF